MMPANFLVYATSGLRCATVATFAVAAPVAAFGASSPVTEHIAKIVGRPQWTTGENELIVIVEKSSGDSRIVNRLRVSGTGVKVLESLRAPADCTLAQYDPKQRVYILGGRPKRGAPYVFTAVSANGSKRTPLGSGQFPSISPDGHYLGFSSIKYPTTFQVIDTRTRRVYPLKISLAVPHEDVRPSWWWRSDSRAVALFKQTVKPSSAGLSFGTNISLFDASAATTWRERVMPLQNPHSAASFGIGWIDDTALLYGRNIGSASENGHLELYSLDLKSRRARARRVSTARVPIPYSEANWLQHGNFGFPIDQFAREFLLVSAKTGATKKIHNRGGGSMDTFRFSPDGRWLALVDRTNTALQIIDCRSNKKRELVIPFK